MDLINHIQNVNAKIRAWVAEDPSNRWSTELVEDMAFWAEQGITTVEQFLRDGLISDLWDLYKEVNGIRPRHMDMASMTNEQLQKEIDWLRDCLKADAANEAERLQEAVVWIEEQEKQANEATANAEWEQKWGVYYERLVGV